MATATQGKRRTTLELQPLGDRVLVEREQSEERTAGGIVLPDKARGKSKRGKVLSVGSGKSTGTANGSRRPSSPVIVCCSADTPVRKSSSTVGRCC